MIPPPRSLITPLLDVNTGLVSVVGQTGKKGNLMLDKSLNYWELKRKKYYSGLSPYGEN
jgi:hypothetical protein